MKRRLNVAKFLILNTEALIFNALGFFRSSIGLLADDVEVLSAWLHKLTASG